MQLSPRVKVATVNAWIRARTVTCPNPACGIEAPLVRWLFRLPTARRVEELRKGSSDEHK